MDTAPFGMLEIKAKHDLSRLKSLYLIHPWLDALLDREDGAGDDDSVAPNSDDEISDEENDDGDDDEDDDEGGEEEKTDDDASSLKPESPSHFTPSHMAPVDRETGARRLAAHLRQPFGALLLTPKVEGRRVVGYKRVAADVLITVRFQDDVSLTDILNNVRTLDVL